MEPITICRRCPPPDRRSVHTNRICLAQQKNRRYRRAFLLRTTAASTVDLRHRMHVVEADPSYTRAAVIYVLGAHLAAQGIDQG